jgi:methionyl-tRNA formyltransferase
MIIIESLPSSIKPAKIKILFLGHSKRQTGIIAKLIDKQCYVSQTADKITTTQGFDLVISYGYRHILSKKIIKSSCAPIINLHIGYLPWNRGAHPNFWSFYDQTPIGVTIHQIDEGIDTGPIIYQQLVNFSEDDNTFSKTYRKLVEEIETLFLMNLDEIILNKFSLSPQPHNGTYHSISDLPKEFSGWDSNIEIEIARLKSLMYNF